RGDAVLAAARLVSPGGDSRREHGTWGIRMSGSGTQHRMLRSRALAAVAVSGLLVSLLAACTSDPIPMPTPTTSISPSASAPEPSETAAPVDPDVFVPGGSAADNLGYFTTTIETLIANGGAG